MTVLALKLSRLRQRRQRPARRGLAADVAAALPEPARGGGADRPHHQRRPRPDLGGAPDAPALRPPPGHRLAAGTSGCPRPGTGIETVDDAELWETQQVLKARLINFVRSRLVAQARRRDEPDAAVAAGHGGARPERADHRLRPPVRHLQAGRPDPPGRRAAGRAGQGRRPADPDHLRRQGPPRGPHGQGADPEHRPAHPAGPVRATASSSSKTTT